MGGENSLLSAGAAGQQIKEQHGLPYRYILSSYDFTSNVKLDGSICGVNMVYSEPIY